ncbi:SAM-dependent methyltransferase [Reichenbachiella sp. MALMAid0571]|uniref:class I SAM-dependent methyltransferase n=1 Tax=Reichenbachiella sp. MALMAid0571 TaxID=3143939 RepID=UPI0032DE6EDA
MKDFLDEIRNCIDAESFVKLTLSKPSDKQSELTNVYVRPIKLKNEPRLSFTYKYKTNDQVKNFDLAESVEQIKTLIEEAFKNATLFTTQNNWSLQTSKKGKISVKKSPPSLTEPDDISHDRSKTKRADSSKPYLHFLGITDKKGNIIPKMADKYRQINKYLEIIEGLISSADMPENISVVDMGSGKGYLTFALYDYLQNTLKLKAQVTGIELRKELVGYCNLIAQQCEFTNLKFECKPIQEFEQDKIDILIALHACDTATDDAIAKGILSKAQLIICAPCCHKQIRQQVKGKEQESPLLKYGIFKERQFEMVTDTIRALIMEEHQYQSKIFEFVSNEHTRKNIMLVGVKSQTKKANISRDKIDSIKKEFQIDEHYLERLVDKHIS